MRHFACKGRAAKHPRAGAIDACRGARLRCGRPGSAEARAIDPNASQAPATITRLIERANQGDGEALNALGAVHAGVVQVVETRYFGGLTEEEIGAALGVTERTVRRDWEKARLLLAIALK